ncbi:MAG: alpha/beta hydrolase [Pseudomonadales bacterium]
MANFKLYYATNRNHVLHRDSSGTRFRPDAYGSSFSSSGYENLRFGQLSVQATQAEVNRYLDKSVNAMGQGDGLGLAGYFCKCAKTARIRAYQENGSGANNAETVLGSRAMFEDLKVDMDNASDVMIYIHGFNISWHEAVGAALGLQTILNAKGDKPVVVVLFSWPSDGKMIPYASYRSDRADAEISGKPVARGLLKMRDFLIDLGREKRNLCHRDIHLLCHSMGNYVLQNSLQAMQQFNQGRPLPRLFEKVFLCAADVDDDALEPGEPLAKAHQICRNLSIYHNREDSALMVSDYTKGQPERLGGNGAARPNQLHNKIHQIDCQPLVHGIVEHSYYLRGKIAGDIRQSIDGLEPDAPERNRTPTGGQENVWAIC